MNEFNLRARLGDISFDPDSIKLYAFQIQGKNRYIAKKLELTAAAERHVATEPFLTIQRHEAQMLINDLWDCGLRPSEGSGSAGAMLAIQDHLKDMKTIAFHALKIGRE